MCWRRCDDRNRDVTNGEAEVMPLLEGGQEQGIQAAAKGKDQTVLQSLQKERSPANILVLAQRDPLQTSDLQNDKRINICCFKLLNLW